jgi:hypothetical protein
MRRFWWLPVSGLLAASLSQAQGSRSHVGAAFGTTSYDRLSGAGPAAIGMRDLVIGRRLTERSWSLCAC